MPATPPRTAHTGPFALQSVESSHQDENLDGLASASFGLYCHEHGYTAASEHQFRSFPLPPERPPPVLHPRLGVPVSSYRLQTILEALVAVEVSERCVGG